MPDASQELAQRVGALEALLRQIQPSNATTATTTVSGLTLTWLSSPVQVLSNASGALAWTGVTSSVPSTAKAVLLSATGRRTSGVTGLQLLSVRAPGSSNSYRLLGQYSAGVDSDTEGETAQGFFPVSSGRFEYQVDAGYLNVDLFIYGYLS